MDDSNSPAVGVVTSRSSASLVDGQPGGPAGAGTTGPSLCLWCGAPLPPAARRTLHPKQFCNAACRSQAHQYLRVEEIRETVASLTDAAGALHRAHAEICALIATARGRLHRFTLSARERRHHAGSFPPASGRSPADILRARRTVRRVLDELPAESGTRLRCENLREVDGDGTGGASGRPDGPGPVAPPVAGARDRDAVHPARLNVVAPAELGGRDRSGDRGEQCGHAHAPGRVQRDGVGE